MQLPKLKVLAEAGAVREVKVSYATGAEGWTVAITYASRLGERSLGVLDAGAVSCCLILTNLAESVEAQLQH